MPRDDIVDHEEESRPVAKFDVPDQIYLDNSGDTGLYISGTVAHGDIPDFIKLLELIQKGRVY